MAEINTDTGGTKKGKPKKIRLRVDFTPMVDMNMLLLTFFMFCTSLSRPQVMELVLPTKEDQVLTEEEKNKVKDSKAITLILGKDDKVYYYFGKIDEAKYADYTSLHETDYSPNGIRAILLERNADAVRRITDLKRKKLAQEISEEEFKSESARIKSNPDGQVVVIKPTDDSSYRNMVDVLDEMQICSIGKYALVEMTDGDHYLLRNYLTQGGYAATGELPQ
ncbi:ExbD/TolR family protein [Gallalistipes aquisgranensis]|uniref:ExbD/TolR family protein n=1 Tax=Gallalistipes aquisgranensis TaxID=2779358 RepID=UPI001CF913C9|nr:biopolymer transporter ExbD [Gallalistipes aquisgranensis]MBE5033095.1 biopolymer transporter ExbD [Gallalistipes aquisgranensis]